MCRTLEILPIKNWVTDMRIFRANLLIGNNFEHEREHKGTPMKPVEMRIVNVIHDDD